MKVFPYIYESEKSIEVLHETEIYFENNPEIKNRIEELGWIYNTVGMIIPQTMENLWSGHFFPFSESWDELQISFNLCNFGFYKQAFTSLRSGLELGLLSVFYNINDEGHKEVENWYKSKDSKDSNTPFAKDIWNTLLSNKNIKRFNERFNLRSQHESLGYLHNYVHTKGFKFSNKLGIPKGNFQTFEPTIFDEWLIAYSEIITLISTLHLLKYPLAVVRFDYQKKFGIDIPSFGGLEEYNIDKIAKILPEGYLEEIELIALYDENTRQVLSEIASLPDMTPNEIEDQVICIEKSMIEHGEGFTKWLIIQESVLKQLGELEFSDVMKKRIEILQKWATKNHFLEPKSKRLGWDLDS